MTTVALVGASGFVGAALHRAAAAVPDLRVVAVTRATYESAKEGSYDVLINAAMPSKRFDAKNRPQVDFLETVKKTADLLYSWRYERFVQVSSISARSQLDTVYGRHKAAAESLCDPARSLIVRLGPMYGSSLSKGVLIDLLNGRTVFVDGNSRYSFAPVDYVASWIMTHLEQTGLVELGARNSIALRDVAARMGVQVQFEGSEDHQEPRLPPPGAPDVTDVFAFLERFKSGPSAS